jgi:biotin operon repressor
MDTELLSRELIRALRGKRSQAALSRHLRYRTNVVYAWESGRNAPTAAQLFGLAQRSGIDLHQALRGFFRVAPKWVDQVQLQTAEGVLQLLVELRGALPLTELARSTGMSRFALSRLFKGQAQPKAPQFFGLIQACTRRLLDFVSLLVDPEMIPSIRAQWRQQQARRETATRAPWSPAVLAALELLDYHASSEHRDAWLAERLHISEEQVRECVALLRESGQIKSHRDRFEPTGVEAVELNEDRALARSRREFWSRTAADRAALGQGMTAYNVCGVSRQDLQRLKVLQREYLARAREIIAESQPVECVALIQVHVLDLAAPIEGGVKGGQSH